MTLSLSMALRKMLSKRLYDGVKIKSPSVSLELSPISNVSIDAHVPLNATKTSIHREYVTSPESADKGFFRRFLHRRAQNLSSTKLPECLTLPVGEKLREKLRELDITGDRLRLKDVKPPVTDQAVFDSDYGLSVNDAKKILKLYQVEKLKGKLREFQKCSISYSDFLHVCFEACENQDQGYEFAKMLDESGNVIVLGNVVFLRPEQVAKSMRSFISESIATPNDPRKQELDRLEKQKTTIDQKARALVRGELFSGLGFLLIQTFAAMRLTFWELSWDVMEPICFFVGSLHFALCYGYFLRTSTEPSFQSYSQRRFLAKQKRLMEIDNFDMEKYTQLRKAFYPDFTSSNQYSPLHGSAMHH